MCGMLGLGEGGLGEGRVEGFGRWWFGEVVEERGGGGRINRLWALAR